MKMSVIISENYKWKHLSDHGFDIYYRNISLKKKTLDKFVKSFNKKRKIDCALIKKNIKILDGHFSIIIKRDSLIIGVVDRICTSPIYYLSSLKEFKLSNNVSLIKNSSEMRDIDDNVIQNFISAGYTIGRSTIYKNIYKLEAGSFIIFNAETRKISVSKYYNYSPYKPYLKNKKNLKKKLTEITLGVLEGVRDAGYEQILVPLSAGYDSRLVVSGLYKINTKNVFCFSYGLKNNFEASYARLVANKLNYKWKFIELTIKSQKKFFSSAIFKNYLSYADSFCSVPFRQDIYPIYHLKKNNLIQKKSIIVNGNTGDFISGGHIPEELFSSSSNVSKEERLKKIVHLIIKKHFSLWVGTSTNYSKTKEQIYLLLSEVLNQVKSYYDYGLYEYFEYMNRQSKFIISNQKIYDFFDLDWNLPLWSNEYIDFWEKVPIQLKKRQRLYKEMLQENNWGKVWSNIPVNSYRITPNWIRPLRLLSKILHLPLGKKSWHSFEKKYFSYFTDNIVSYAEFSYLNTILKKKIARNSVSWHTDKYIREKFNDEN